MHESSYRHSLYFRNPGSPRVCGKDRLYRGWPIERAGSPPRVRERPLVEQGATDEERITPACAGKTLCEMNNSEFVEDHPRVCGKDCIAMRLIKHVCGKDFTRRLNSNAAEGSPPRVRERLHGKWLT